MCSVSPNWKKIVYRKNDDDNYYMADYKLNEEGEGESSNEKHIC